MEAILFYSFSFIVIGSAVKVISSRNPVYSVLFLILAFFNTAGLFILLNAELLAMMLVIVYVGAVAVLFLFVVMMLNINFARVKEGMLEYLPLGVLVAVILFAEIFFALKTSASKVVADPVKLEPITNTEALGRVLYTDYIYIFQISGLILLIAMIGSIVLTLRRREGVRKQDISKQLARRKEKTIEIVQVQSGKGI